MTALTEPSSDLTANEISGISGTWADPTYDAAGNLTSGPKAGDETTRLHFVYDGWNRLIQVKADNGGQPGTTLATYGYDGLGRRISNNPASGTVDYYYNEQYQVLEVRKNGDADAYEQYVYSQRYIDAPVMVYRDTNTDGTVDQKIYVAQDANFNVTTTVNGDTGAATSGSASITSPGAMGSPAYRRTECRATGRTGVLRHVGGFWLEACLKPKSGGMPPHSQSADLLEACLKPKSGGMPPHSQSD